MTQFVRFVRSGEAPRKAPHRGARPQGVDWADACRGRAGKRRTPGTPHPMPFDEVVRAG
jgi:hypothetical protein